MASSARTSRGKIYTCSVREGAKQYIRTEFASQVEEVGIKSKTLHWASVQKG